MTMINSLPRDPVTERDQERALDVEGLRDIVEEAAHLLPSQGPITSFVHHNTLHAFEHLHFHAALRSAWQVYRRQPYLSEEQFLTLLERGQIEIQELSEVLMEDLGEEADHLIGLFGTRYHLRLVMLQYRVGAAPAAELRWAAAESQALRKFRKDLPPGVRERILAEIRRWVMRDLSDGRFRPSRDPGIEPSSSTETSLHKMISGLFDRFGHNIELWTDGIWEEFSLNLLWRLCHQGVHGLPAFGDPPRSPVRHRDALLNATGEDVDSLVNEVLIRFCSVYLDQGFATWSLPERNLGFLASFSALYSEEHATFHWWMRGVSRELQRFRNGEVTPLESIAESLHELGVTSSERHEYLQETLLALRGWAGMIWQLETNIEWARNRAPRGTLVEYLAVRLILERAALKNVARRALGENPQLADLRHRLHPHSRRRPPINVDQRAYQVFQLIQIVGWPAENLAHLPKEQWNALVREIEKFNSLERRRIYHAACERKYLRETLDAFSQFVPEMSEQPGRPRFQVVCCIDDREESFRRHLEEIAPECGTFGIAGFFAVAMYYRGAGDAQFQPLCPVVIKPRHFVQEEVLLPFAEQHRRRAGTRRTLGTVLHRWHLESRSFLGGIVTGLLGSLASIPMVMRILFPRLTARVRRRMGHIVEPPRATQLHLHRVAPEPGPHEQGWGYSLDEMTAIVERVLRETGLSRQLSRLVLVLGHGSSSLNNPHESAYNCGACSGGRGGPNARAFAHMANDHAVRQRLAQRGLAIPDDVWVLGGYHNTCDDSVVWYDLDRLPLSHRSDFTAASQAVDAARKANAHERCRRFESAPLTLTGEEALRHVEQRAEDLSQTRPEYNHATNALCIVGRRERTRGLFLDRRAFLASYDPTLDDSEHTILLQILQAVVPVCAGISLEYYFSSVDPSGFGCGSKLPHNITSLLGVMEGAASDLRTGLSQQMIEIHEPLRILFVIETTPQVILSLMERNETIRRLITNEWIQLATLDPHSSTIHQYTRNGFKVYSPGTSPLPVVNRSIDWYRGWRDHLGFASILASSIEGTGGRRAPQRHTALSPDQTTPETDSLLGDH